MSRSRVTVSLDFTTRKKLSDDMIFSMSEQLAHLSASFSVARDRKSASVVMTIQSWRVQHASMDAERALEHEMSKYGMKPIYTRIEMEGAV